jgi:Domain of unknown function (DUF4193)
LANDTQQREADDREYDDLDDLEALAGGAEDDDESSPEAAGEEDESTAGTEEDDDESPPEAEGGEDESTAATEEDDDVVTLDDDELQQASLEQLRERTARKRLDLDEDEDLLALVSDPDLPDADLPDAEAAPARVTPIESRQEFVCARCRLVKPRVQLADSARGLCRDCA